MTAAGATPAAARILADAYLERRGYAGAELLAVRQRPTKMGILGYVAWDLRFRVVRKRAR